MESGQVSSYLRNTDCEIAGERTEMTCGTCGDLFGFSFSGDDGDMLLQYLFRGMDINGDGVVTKKELLVACTEWVIRTALLTGFPGLSLDAIFKEVDADHSETITVQEFGEALRRRFSSVSLGLIGSPELPASSAPA